MKVLCFNYRRNIQPFAITTQTINFYELTFVFKGEMLYFVNGTEYRLQAGDGIFIKPNSTRQRPTREDTATYVSFTFTTEKPIDLPVKIPNALNNECKLLIACADEIRNKQYADSEEQVEALVECMVANVRANIEYTKEHPLVLQIKQFINANLSEKITLQQIGEETYFSPLYCETVFRQKTGTSIIKYVTKRRIEEAQKLLFDGQLSLRIIAEKVGFEDYNYFARVFKKTTGSTPTEYKKLFVRERE